MSGHTPSKQRAKVHPKADTIAEQRRQAEDALRENVSAPTLARKKQKSGGADAIRPTACEFYFDPLSRTLGMQTTGRHPQLWPAGSNEALNEAAEFYFYSNRDLTCWLLAAARLQNGKAKTFVVRVEPVPEGTDGAEQYLEAVFIRAFEKLYGNQTEALTAIAKGRGSKVWLTPPDAVRFGVSSRKPYGYTIRTAEDCLGVLGFKVDTKRYPDLLPLAQRTTALVEKIKAMLLIVPDCDSEIVWKATLNNIDVVKEVDSRTQSVVLLPEEEKARMPHDNKAKSPTKSAVLAKVIGQAHHEGFETLTKRSLRCLRDSAIERLKVVDQDDDVKRRAIAEDIFPIAKFLFPSSITKPADINAASLTKLFKAKASDPDANTEPLSKDQLDAIKRLTQVWRKHFSNVRYRGKPASVTSAGKDGLLFRTATARQQSLGTKKFWPKLTF